MSDIAALLGQLMALHPSEIDLTLDRLRRLLDDLGNPERRLPPVVHIAGTNGKGSTLAMLRAGLSAAGHRVHAYTSPHLVRFNERIELAGHPISDSQLNDVLTRVIEVNAGQSITFFEATTAAAFVAMSESPADFALVEVGLGGLLDATNLVTPQLCIITPVALDHQDYLGDTLTEIAGEKAGILKRDVPCVVGRQQEAALNVIEARAARLNVTLHRHGQEWQIGPDRDRLSFHDEHGLVDLPRPALRGTHQIDNAGMAVAALRLLTQDATTCEAALSQAHWPARMQRLSDGALQAMVPDAELWLDGGHNPAAGQALAALLADLPPRPTVLVCAMLKTKDARGFMAPLSAHADRLLALSIPQQTQTLSAQETAAAARSAGLVAATAKDLPSALREITRTQPRTRIVICGSLYFAGHALSLDESTADSAR